MPGLELSGVTVVCAGSFNPAIFHPTWLAKKELIPGHLAESAVSGAGGREMVVTSQLAAYVADWLTVQITQNQAVFATVDSARSPDLRDLVVSVLKLLPESPVRAVGINTDAHFRAASEEAWHAFGDKFLPKDFWEPLFSDGPWKARPDGKHVGMRVMTVEVAREGEFPGHVRVELAPSTRIGPNGIYIGTNGHFQVGSPTSPGNGLEASRIIEHNWESTRDVEQKVIATLTHSV